MRAKNSLSSVFETVLSETVFGPLPMKTLRNFESQVWLEIITSRDAESACFKGSRTSCDVTIMAFFGRLAEKDHIT